MHDKRFSQFQYATLSLWNNKNNLFWQVKACYVYREIENCSDVDLRCNMHVYNNNYILLGNPYHLTVFFNGVLELLKNIETFLSS